MLADRESRCYGGTMPARLGIVLVSFVHRNDCNGTSLLIPFVRCDSQMLHFSPAQLGNNKQSKTDIYSSFCIPRFPPQSHPLSTTLHFPSRFAIFTTQMSLILLYTSIGPALGDQFTSMH